MRIKIIFIFLIAILIPTTLLAYFGLLAVRSEKSIIERNTRQRYEAMVDIVFGEIKATLGDMPEEVLKDSQYLESLLLGEASIFKGQVKIFDREGRTIGGRRENLENSVFYRPIENLPYIIASYEPHPMLLKRLERKKRGFYLYVVIIGFSALSILGGGFFALRALSREWRLTELKSEFVSGLSHDLRTPLTSIRMFSEMLQAGRIPTEEKRQEYYNIITNESEKLTHLANNILDFSRIERGGKEYNFKPEDIAKVVTEAVQRFKNYIVEEPRQISLNINDSFPPLKIDVDSISQAVLNLLSNAAKYSPPDKKILVNLIKDKKNVIIEIIDKGIGIPKSEQKKIFRKFYRMPQKSAPERETGSGLGLTLVKYTAVAHKGRVDVESGEGEGSKFSLILPISRQCIKS